MAGSGREAWVLVSLGMVLANSDTGWGVPDQALERPRCFPAFEKMGCGTEWSGHGISGRI